MKKNEIEKQMEIIEIASTLFKDSKPLEGEPLRILKQTAKRMLSKTPTTLRKK